MRSDRNLKLRSSEMNILGSRNPHAMGERGQSLSGHERNHLFLSDCSRQFYDVAGISGLDHPGDGRAFAILDYDRDGWQDIAVVNANTPFFQLYRNRIGERKNIKSNGNILALRFVGGNNTSKPSTQWSTRDGFGALVSIKLEQSTLKREHRAGEGMAAQNSATMIIGIGSAREAAAITVRWPSGKTQEIQNIPTATLITVYENPAQSPTGEEFVLQPYRRFQSSKSINTSFAAPAAFRKLSLHHPAIETSPAKLRIYTTMATWCAACKRELPQLWHLQSVFNSTEIALFGLPVDEKDSPEKLNAYIDKHQPAYKLLTGLPAKSVARTKAIIKSSLKMDGLPATVITDHNNYVLQIMWGVPSVSDIRELLVGFERNTCE